MKLFISFDWNDRAQINGFRSMLANPAIEPLSHRDTSIKHDYLEFGKNEIKRQILSHIQYSNVIVCLISQKTKHSDWVNWELEQAREQHKSIVGIVLKDQPVKTLKGAPEFFTRYTSYQVHHWSTPSELNRIIRNA